MPVPQTPSRTEVATLHLLTPDDVATVLGVTSRTVRAIAARGELPKIVLGPRTSRYRLSDVLAYLDRHTHTRPNEKDQ